MKHTMNKWMAAIALISCVACSKTETDFEKATSMNEKGKVYGYFAPIIDDDAPETRGYRNPDWSYTAEVGDQVNIWSNTNTLMIHKIVSFNDNGHFELQASGYDLKPGQSYTATYPFVLNNVVNLPTSQVLTYEGQTQTDQTGSQLRELANYTYTWAVGTCDENGNTSFLFDQISTFMKVVATLPRSGMTIKEVKLTADKALFALNGTADLSTGAFTPTGSLSEDLTMTLNNVTVSGNVLTAYFASAPIPEAASYVVSITDTDNKVYTSPAVSKSARNHGKSTTFNVTVESEERNYELVTSMPSDPAGKYILVYPVDGKYRAFSFAKTMENAETAASSVNDVVGLENLYNHADDLYTTVVRGNYVEITGEANATTLTLNPEQEAAAALDIAANATPWTVTAPAKDLQTTFTSGSFTLKVDHLVANVASDGKADLVAAFNAPDAVAIMTALRGHEVNVTFDQLIDLAIAKTTTTSYSNLEKEGLKQAFEKMCRIAKDIVPNHPEIFGAGSTLMDIDRTTNVFTVFSQYHDNVANLSWSINPQKRFGLANLGYNVNTPGFTVSVNLPSSEWFTRLNDSIKAAGKLSFDPSTHSMSLSRDKAAFVGYWAAFDNNSQYDIKVNGVKIENFYQRLAGRLFDELNDTEFMGLYYLAQSNKITALGNSYNTLAGKLNTGIQPAYIYKKVVE